MVIIYNKVDYRYDDDLSKLAKLINEIQENVGEVFETSSCTEYSSSSIYWSPSIEETSCRVPSICCAMVFLYRTSRHMPLNDFFKQQDLSVVLDSNAKYGYIVSEKEKQNNSSLRLNEGPSASARHRRLCIDL